MTSVQCFNPQQAHAAIAAHIWPMVKSMTMAGHRVTVEVKEEKRSLAENRLLHAMLTHISDTQEWAGKKRDVETWKRLMVAAWCRAKGEQIEMLPAIDGHGFDILFRRTSKMSKAEVAELIDYVEAWRTA